MITKNRIEANTPVIPKVTMLLQSSQILLARLQTRYSEKIPLKKLIDKPVLKLPKNDRKAKESSTSV